MNIVRVSDLFYVDYLTIAMLVLVSFISWVVWIYAKTYMQGDKKSGRFLRMVILLSIAVATMVSADNIILFMAALAISNYILIQLMVHKSEWAAAKSSGALAQKYLLMSFVCLSSGFAILCLQTGEYSIQAIINAPADRTYISIIALSISFIGAMMQSALWPFHRWLISSLNSPTPASALMHAGIINGGGFMLIRFGSLYLKYPNLLNVIFIVGLLSAFIGTLLKLVQNDYKRMLASSTMGQMGFMILQCGLGLFSAALAHLCWHGIFKAYLFLVSGSAAQNSTPVKIITPGLRTFGSAILLGGVLGTYIFSLASGTLFFNLDTTVFLKGIVFIAATQFALNIVSVKTNFKILLAICTTIVVASVYGGSVRVFHTLLTPLNLDAAQPINVLHIVGFAVLLFAWLAMIFRRPICKFDKLKHFRNRMYVIILNACQPHQTTVTSGHNQYKY